MSNNSGVGSHMGSQMNNQIDFSEATNERLEQLLTKKVHTIEKAFANQITNMKPIVFNDAI